MTRKAGRPEGRRYRTRKPSLGIQSKFVEAQHTVDESLHVPERGIAGLSDAIGMLVSQLHKLAAEFQQVMPASPGDRLEELVESTYAIERATARWQHGWFRLERKCGERDEFGVIATEALPNSDHAAVHESGFSGQSRGPGADEIESNILIAPRSRHVQLAGIGLRDSCKHVLVFQCISSKSL